MNLNTNTTSPAQHELVMVYTDNPREVAERFWRNGVVVLERFYPGDQMRELASALDALVNADPNRAFGGGDDYARLRETRVRVWSGKDLPEVQRAMNDPRMATISEAICGPGYLPAGEGVFSTPRDCGQGWHQDSRARERDRYELNRIVFPRDVDARQGALCVVPGSHLGPDLPRGGNHDPLPGQQSVLPTAGSLVLMHTRCYHRVEFNRCDQPRTQCNSRVRPATAPENLCNTPVFRTGNWNFASSRPE